MMTNSSDNVALQEAQATEKHQLTTHEKYLFDTEFDFSETVADIQSITLKQQATSNEHSYQEGYDKGVLDTNESITRMASDQLFVITNKIDDLIEAEKSVVETFYTQVAQVSELIASKVMPVLLNQGALDEVKAILEQSKKLLPKDKKITIEVHHSLMSDIQKHFDVTPKEDMHNTEIELKEGTGFDLTDCKISWDGAGIEHYTSTLIENIKESLLRLGGDSLEIQPEQSPEPQPNTDKEVGEKTQSPEAQNDQPESKIETKANNDLTEA